jgi:MFS family permease
VTDNIPRTRENDVADAAVPHNSKVGLATLGLLLGALLSVLDQTIVGVALPDMAEDFGGMGSISWVVTAYLLASTVTATLYGRISDRLGRRGVFLAAVTIFVVGSILCGAAQSTGQLIAARTLQGIGAGGSS